MARFGVASVWRALFAACTMNGAVIFRVWEGDSMTRAGAGGKTSQVLHQVCLASPATMAMTPCSLFLSACIVQFLSQRATLRVGHSPLGCKDHKASATLTRVVLMNNKIEDRGAVALAAAVKA